MRAALYARVSTVDQQTLPMQEAALREYADRRGWLVTLAASEVSSGAKVRPMREQILAECRRRRLDAVVVWKLDRWGRSTSDLVGTLEELRALGIVFVSITEAIDLSTPSGKLVAGVLAVIAEFERDLIIERVRAGMARAKADGKRLGRRPTARAKGPIIRKMYAKMKRDGNLNISEIARRLDVGRASVLRAIADGA